jgi:hypothetical protein
MGGPGEYRRIVMILVHPWCAIVYQVILMSNTLQGEVQQPLYVLWHAYIRVE